jgi:hypothetical protein
MDKASNKDTGASKAGKKFLKKMEEIKDKLTGDTIL